MHNAWTINSSVMENEQNITLKPGEFAEVNLQSRPGTGLQLRYRCEDETIIQVRRKEEGDVPKPMPAKLGGSIPAIFEIKALKEGETKVTFYETRTWDKDFKEIIQKQIRLKVS